MVTARHPLAAEAGASTLQRGGNAADGAIAAILANGVVQPFATSIGGGGLLTAFSPDGSTYTMDYRCEAPAAATADMYGKVSVSVGQFGWAGVPNQANQYGHRAAAVPGTITGLITAHQKLGRLPWATVLEPAIALAADGFEMDWYGALTQGTYLDQLVRFENTARIFLREGRYPYRPRREVPGDVFRQPELAETLREVAEHGMTGYLEGLAGRALVSEMADHDGIITADDLANYRPREATPRRISFRDYTVIGPANGGLYALLFAVFNQLDLVKHEPLSPTRLHLVAETIRRCRKFEAEYAEDGWLALLDEHPELGAEIASTIDPRTCTDDWQDLWWGKEKLVADVGHERTVHVCAVDSDGAVVSLTETILGGFGSSVTTFAGMLLNNSMFAFAPIPGYTNSIAPGCRPHSNMSPVIVLNQQGKPVLAAGASAGQRISAAVVQVVLYILDQGLSAQEAVATPRLDVIKGTTILDHRIPTKTVAELERLGHRIEQVEEDLFTLHFANPAAVTIDENGLLRSGVNPMHVTAAVGW